MVKDWKHVISDQEQNKDVHFQPIYSSRDWEASSKQWGMKKKLKALKLEKKWCDFLLTESDFIEKCRNPSITPFPSICLSVCVSSLSIYLLSTYLYVFSLFPILSYIHIYMDMQNK